MSKVKVSYFGLILQKVSGGQEEEVCLSEEATVRDLLQILAEKHGDEFRESILTSDGQLHPVARVFVNDSEINEFNSLDTRLGDDSELSITVMPGTICGG